MQQCSDAVQPALQGSEHMHAYDASRHTMCQCIYVLAHVGGMGRTDVRNFVLLVYSEQYLAWDYSQVHASTLELSLIHFLLYLLLWWTDSFAFFSEAFNTHFCTWFRQICIYLWMHRHTVLPFYHCQKNFIPPSNSILHQHLRVMHVSVTPEFLGVGANWHSERDHKLAFLCMTDTYVCTHIPRINPSFRVLC